MLHTFLGVVMDKLKLQEQVLVFLDAAVDSIQIQNAKGDGYLDAKEVLRMWNNVPGCQLSFMFLGYMLAMGHDINSFTPEEMDLAVQAAYAGSDDVDFNWLGDIDENSKPP
jgi:hypothetical protein